MSTKAQSSRELSQSERARKKNSFFRRNNDPFSKTLSGDKSSSGKPFKKIRGFLTGETRKERKARKEAARAAAAANQTPTATAEDEIDDDEETVYGVVTDNASTATGASAPAPHLLDTSRARKSSSMSSSMSVPANLGSSLASVKKSLQVIVLLMDPVTRRFELLQLEFDTNMAVVRDVLSQIPHSVTEEALRQQTYMGVCDRSGHEFINSMRLSSFCDGTDVLVAIPEGMAARDCARLSRPILSDQKVVAMLKSTGVNVAPLQEAANESAPDKRTRAVSDVGGISGAKDTPQKKKKKGGTGFFGVLFVLLLAIMIPAVHVIWSSPLKKNQVLSPGMTLSKCGLLSFFPPNEYCENAFLGLDTEGVLTLFGPDGKAMEWQIVGGVCDPEDESCIQGAVMKEDGSLAIGGKIVTSVVVKGDARLSPWPFVEPPTLRIVKSRK